MVNLKLFFLRTLSVLKTADEKYPLGKFLPDLQLNTEKYYHYFLLASP